MGASNDYFNDGAAFLKELPLSTLVKNIMVSCVEAQASAADSSKRYFEHFLCDGKSSNAPVAEVCFSYMAEGKICQLVVPLITILPLPNLMINTVNINFDADVSVIDERDMSVNMLGLDCELDRQQDVSLNSNLSLSISACGFEIPSGMAKLLETIGNYGIIIEDIDTFPEESSDEVLSGIDKIDEIDEMYSVDNPVSVGDKMPFNEVVASSNSSVSNGYLNRIVENIETNGKAILNIGSQETNGEVVAS